MIAIALSSYGPVGTVRAGLIITGMVMLSTGCDGRSVSSSQDGSHSQVDAGDVVDAADVVDAGDVVDVVDIRDSLADAVTVTCGDGVRGGDEVCDGADLGGVTCADLPGFVSGDLACQGDCAAFNTGGCVPAGPGCGNQVIDTPEVCDGVDLDGLGCTDFGYAEGDLWCAGDCSGFLMHGCYPTLPGTCGDGVLDEWCDGNQFIDDCQYFGFTGGALGCTAGCHYEFSGCIGDACAAEGLYGDGVCDPCPLMGGTVDPDCAQVCGVADGACTSYLFYELGFDSCSVMTGMPDPDCGVCGDGVAELYESCDGNDIGPDGYTVTCQDLGFSGGTLACDANCIFDTSGCTS